MPLPERLPAAVVSRHDGDVGFMAAPTSGDGAFIRRKISPAKGVVVVTSTTGWEVGFLATRETMGERDARAATTLIDHSACSGCRRTSRRSRRPGCSRFGERPLVTQLPDGAPLARGCSPGDWRERRKRSAERWRCEKAGEQFAQSVGAASPADAGIDAEISGRRTPRRRHQSGCWSGPGSQTIFINGKKNDVPMLIGSMQRGSIFTQPRPVGHSGSRCSALCAGRSFMALFRSQPRTGARGSSCSIAHQTFGWEMRTWARTRRHRR